ncbi:MAG TPA: hypothetical protein VFP01_06445 [Propionibacteriaceae bacterium]|nr:hypothetical protein [Propionibacteriaceae bacterium]
MRTTITLTPEVEALVKKAMAQRKLSFKEVVNEAILRGLAADRRPHEFHTKTHSMGRPRINLDKATQVAGELDTQDFLRKMSSGQ